MFSVLFQLLGADDVDKKAADMNKQGVDEAKAPQTLRDVKKYVTRRYRRRVNV